MRRLFTPSPSRRGILSPSIDVEETRRLNVINPLSMMGIELYLDTRFEMGGYAHGATVNPWFDLTTFNRDLARDAALSQIATFRISDTTAPSGAPVVRFTKPGADARAVYLFRDGIPNLNNVNGYTFICWIRSRSTPTVGRTILRMEPGSRPEVGYASLPPPASVYAFATGGPGYTYSYILPQSPVILCNVWNPPINATGTQQLYTTVGTSPVAVLQDTETPWNWNSALASGFRIGVMESLSNFIDMYDLGAAAVWSRNLSPFEIQGVFNWFHIGFGL